MNETIKAKRAQAHIWTSLWSAPDWADFTVGGGKTVYSRLSSFRASFTACAGAGGGQCTRFFWPWTRVRLIRHLKYPTPKASQPVNLDKPIL